MTIQIRQTIQQRLLMAPNVTLALEILRMPTLELQMFLHQQAEENPLLELEEPATPETDAAPAGEPGTGPGADGPASQDDWSPQWSEAESDEDNRAQEPGLAKTQSLYDWLFMQLGCLRLTTEQRRLTQALVQQLNEDGYLEGSLEEMAAEYQAEPSAMEGALRILQSCDPPGVGARDVRECLQLQLAQQPNPDPLAARILRDHFELLTQQRLTAIARAVAAPLPEVERACAALKRLTPRPGMAFTGDLPPSVVPDLLIAQRDNHYDIELNDNGLPHIGINRAYHRMLRDPRTPEEARAYLLKKFRQASWVVKSIEERNATMLAIGRCLISLQREFVEHGPKALKPLTQSQVAGLIGRHPSTVSRAVAGKTIDTPYGVFRLEQLFASGVPQHGSNEELSDAAIKSEIERLVKEEDIARPLSDERLAQSLAQRHISVARRTVAKYRTSLKILPAHLRKKR